MLQAKLTSCCSSPLGRSGWGMLPWDYPVRVTWCGCSAFKSHVFVCECVCQWVKCGLWVHSWPPPECWPDCELSQWCFFVEFSGLPCTLPSHLQASEEQHTAPWCVLSLCLFSHNQIVFVYLMDITVIDVLHKADSSDWCHIQCLCIGVKHLKGNIILISHFNCISSCPLVQMIPDTTVRATDWRAQDS